MNPDLLHSDGKPITCKSIGATSPGRAKKQEFGWLGITIGYQVTPPAPEWWRRPGRIPVVGRATRPARVPRVD
jgi:hypothetical protein